MELLDLLKYFVAPAACAYILYNEKHIMKLQGKIDMTATKVEIEHLIDLKLQVRDLEIKGLKEDLHRIELKLDKLIDKLVK